MCCSQPVRLVVVGLDGVADAADAAMADVAVAVAAAGWDYYFALTVILGFPAIALLVYLNYRFFPRCQEALDAQPKEVLSG